MSLATSASAVIPSTYSVLYFIGGAMSMVAFERAAVARGLEVSVVRLFCLVCATLGVLLSFALPPLLGLLRLAPSDAKTSMLGPMLLGAPTAALTARALKLNPRLTLDLAATFLPLAFAIGRIGCYAADCCGGSIGSVPVQLVAALADGGLFAFLYWRLRAGGPDGTLVLWLLLLYGLKRFLLGYFRTDADRVFLGANVFQVLGLGLAIGAGIALLTVRKED